MGLGIVGLSEFIPKNKMSVEQLATHFGYELEPYKEALGIKEKRIATEDDEHPSDMATAAGKKVLEACGVSADQIGRVVSTGSSKDFPGSWTVSQEVAKNLGLDNAVAYDLNAGCVGMLLGIHDSINLPSSRPYTLLVSAERWHETLMPIPELPVGTTCHADGAAACLIGPQKHIETSALALNSLPQYNGFIYTKAGGTRYPAAEQTEREMFGRRKKYDIDIKKEYVDNYLAIIEKVLKENNIKPNQIDFLSMNQARAPMRKKISELSGIPFENCPATYENHGHVGAADLVLSMLKHFRSASQTRYGLLVASNVSLYGALLLKFSPDAHEHIHF